MLATVVAISGKRVMTQTVSPNAKADDRIPGGTSSLFNRLKDFNEDLLFGELATASLKPDKILLAGFDPDFAGPRRRIWSPKSTEAISYGSLAQPGDLRLLYPFTLTTEDIAAIDEVLDTHVSSGTTQSQASNDQDVADFDRLRVYFDKSCSMLTAIERNDAVCRMIRLTLRRRGDQI